ncbi:hypothetical protein G3I38_02465 [Streptomyces sp. SID7958]|nr:hypothetical protein [Streptomyces sp. AS58]KOV62918.1 hypothetical protein ADL00_23390 [Streptomyces sp. AS58]NEC78138.1 hypothetical protein [Streptomyces sp. SID7958]
MYAPPQPSRRQLQRSGDRGAAGFVRLLSTVRGAGPFLLAAVVLAGIGAVLSIAWVVDAAVVLAIAAVVTVLVRRRVHSDAASAHGQAGRRRRRCC